MPLQLARPSPTLSDTAALLRQLFQLPPSPSSRLSASLRTAQLPLPTPLAPRTRLSQSQPLLLLLPVEVRAPAPAVPKAQHLPPELARHRLLRACQLHQLVVLARFFQSFRPLLSVPWLQCLRYKADILLNDSSDPKQKRWIYPYRTQECTYSINAR